jgi:WD40 repeat protein
MRAKGEMEASVGMSVACSSDGTRIAVGCRDRVIRHFWRDSRAKGGKGKSKERMLAKLLFRPDVLSRGHKGEVTCLGWFPLNSTSSLWVSGSSDGCVRLWRPRVPHSCQNARVCGGVLGTGGVTCIKVRGIFLLMV